MHYRALVTGGAGFVGRHLCQYLLDDGAEVVCVDQLCARGGGLPPHDWPLFRPTANAKFVFVHEDCRSYFHRERSYFDVVFHLAAVVGGRQTIECEPLAVATNLAIDADFWRWAERVRHGTIVYFSSSAAYPIALQTDKSPSMLSEEMIDFSAELGAPDLAYGWSKLTGEYLMRLYCARTGCRAVAYRPFSGYGEDQSLAYPVPSICRRLLEKKGASTVEVWGSGRQQRDFIHIDDCIDFIMRTYNDLPNATAINLSSGLPVSFIDLATRIAVTIGYEPVVVGVSSRQEGVFFRCGDRKRQETYKLEPRVPLEEGIRRCVAHAAQNMSNPDVAIL